MSYNKVRCLCFRRKNIYLDVTINNEFILWYFIRAIKEASITEKKCTMHAITMKIPVWNTSESCLLFKYFERQYRLFRKCMFFKHIYTYIFIRNWINIIAILAGYLTEEKKWFAIEIWLLFHGVFCVCCFTERYYNTITLGKVYPILILSLHIFIFVFFLLIYLYYYAKYLFKNLVYCLLLLNTNVTWSKGNNSKWILHLVIIC